MENETITLEQIEILEQLKLLPILTDEDYRKLGEMFGEDE